MKKIARRIAKKDPDVIVLQEVGYEALGILKGYMRDQRLMDRYKGYGPNFSIYKPENFEQSIGRGRGCSRQSPSEGEE
jgi:hypothetical protein